MRRRSLSFPPLRLLPPSSPITNAHLMTCLAHLTHTSHHTSYWQALHSRITYSHPTHTSQTIKLIPRPLLSPSLALPIMHNSRNRRPTSSRHPSRPIIHRALAVFTALGLRIPHVFSTDPLLSNRLESCHTSDTPPAALL